MQTNFDFDQIPETAWCPGCGNFAILKILKEALNELNIDPQKLVISSGIGQAAKTSQYINSHCFNGLHGRTLPVATGIKASNPDLIVVAEGGDGDMYGEGGNHFIHAIRRNIDIVNIVHNNMVYGLTLGQASPTSRREFKTPLQLEGVSSEPFNPIAVAISLGASFVARAFSGDMNQMKEILKEAVKHKGYALVDIFHPCVSFNKINNFKWFKNNTYYLNENYDNTDKMEALKKAFETDKFPLGVIYTNGKNKTFEENLTAYKNDKRPLYKREVDLGRIEKLLLSD
ncbi:MAG: 2-oxoacid ferredoxin oxidoreductase [Bacteroidetes bacterium]|nr:2-oxoacid ferredoxin oxidoreductase [Bacteroidota bacterium]